MCQNPSVALFPSLVVLSLPLQHVHVILSFLQRRRVTCQLLHCFIVKKLPPFYRKRSPRGGFSREIRVAFTPLPGSAHTTEMRKTLIMWPCSTPAPASAQAAAETGHTTTELPPA